MLVAGGFGLLFAATLIYLAAYRAGVNEGRRHEHYHRDQPPYFRR